MNIEKVEHEINMARSKIFNADMLMKRDDLAEERKHKAEVERAEAVLKFDTIISTLEALGICWEYNEIDQVVVHEPVQQPVQQPVSSEARVNYSERLTIKSDEPFGFGYTLKQLDDTDFCCDVCGTYDGGCIECPINKAINLLAEYENTGLTPPEITDLISKNKGVSNSG